MQIRPRSAGDLPHQRHCVRLERYKLLMRGYSLAVGLNQLVYGNMYVD